MLLADENQFLRIGYDFACSQKQELETYEIFTKEQDTFMHLLSENIYELEGTKEEKFEAKVRQNQCSGQH